MSKSSFLMAGVASLSLFASSFAVAQNDEDKPWSIAAELGFITTSGNTDTTSVQGKIEAKQNLTHWQNDYVFSTLFKEDEVTEDDGTKTTEKTAEKYFISAKSAYLLTNENSNVFVYGSHTHDEFGAYIKYSTIAVGYGTRLFENDTMKLDAEIGPGYFRGERVVEDETVDNEATTTVENGVIIRGAASYVWQITETAEFKQTVSVESGEDNTRTIAETSLSTRISDRMQMKVGFSVANDSKVAADKEPTDTTTYVNLVYKF